MTKKTQNNINYRPLIDDTKLRADIQRLGIDKQIGPLQRQAAKELVESFHGNEVYAWKENQHRGTFLNKADCKK
ncbi:hypothetical protein [Levilactobacillus namurensis]|uniref:Uncharacterized protein n=1 Tax=Levilactobacillus namurensis TaxID=380393 RepID=A0AAW8W3A4_9LACO|nr:hypothetical protein [Levilactobacillus namurensis]MDT7013305.1 hypothetical protein [Levilactobacillus namurensis]